MATGTRRRGLGWFNVVAIILVFAAPMVGAWVLYYHFPDLARSWGTTNHGQFISPARPMDLPSSLHTLDGQPLPADFFAGKWTYVYMHSSVCDDRCKGNIYLMRQVRLTQGKEAGRVQRLMIVTDAEGVGDLGAFLRNYPGMKVVTGDAASVAAVAKKLEVSAPAADIGQNIYLVDWRGDVMMYYRIQGKGREMLGEATGMRKDLAKLLRDHKS